MKSRKAAILNECINSLRNLSDYFLWETSCITGSLKAHSSVPITARYGPVYAGTPHRNFLLFMNSIPALINIYIYLSFFHFPDGIYPYFAFKKYIGTSKVPFRALVLIQVILTDLMIKMREANVQGYRKAIQCWFIHGSLNQKLWPISTSWSVSKVRQEATTPSPWMLGVLHFERRNNKDIRSHKGAFPDRLTAQATGIAVRFRLMSLIWTTKWDFV
jgi:hypothetical protein